MSAEGASSRLEAFSDGVFAVAITLLALDLSIDGPGHGSLAHQLDHRWPQFSALFVWSIRSGFQRHPLGGADACRAVLRFGAGNLGYLVAIGVAFASAPLSLAIDAALAVYYVYERTPAGEAG